MQYKVVFHVTNVNYYKGKQDLGQFFKEVVADHVEQAIINATVELVYDLSYKGYHYENQVDTLSIDFVSIKTV